MDRDRPGGGERRTDHVAVTDDELIELALAPGTDVRVADDAVLLSEFLGSTERSEAPASSRAGICRRRWALLEGSRRRIVLLIVVSFVLINAMGLCSTYHCVGFG